MLCMALISGHERKGVRAEKINCVCASGKPAKLERRTGEPERAPDVACNRRLKPRARSQGRSEIGLDKSGMRNAAAARAASTPAWL